MWIPRCVEFMRMRTKKWAKPELAACPFYIADSTVYRGKWKTAFAKEQPIWLELGCGKGLFLAQKAVVEQGVNFIGIDLSSDMLGLSKRNIELKFGEAGLAVDNVKLTWQNIERIEMMFGEEDAIDRIFINFCNPWFKPTQYKKRLTHTRQLVKFKEFLQSGGEIWFKTDDDELFEHSLKYFEEVGFEVLFCTWNLHVSGFEGNIWTEHEKMYTEQGINIKFVIAKKP